MTAGRRNDVRTGKPASRLPDAGAASYLHRDKIRAPDLDNRSKWPRKPASRLPFMPMEGHWARVNTPLRETTPRERTLIRVVIALIAIVAVAVVVAVATGGGGGSSALGPGCIHIEVPSTMGGSASNLCGARAAEFCASPAAHEPPLDATVLPKCRTAGYRTAGRP